MRHDVIGVLGIQFIVTKFDFEFEWRHIVCSEWLMKECQVFSVTYYNEAVNLKHCDAELIEIAPRGVPRGFNITELNRSGDDIVA